MDVNKIKILYDDGGFVMPYGGVARYFTEMIKRLPEDIAWQFGMVGTRNLYLQKPPYNLPPYNQDVHDFVRNTLNGHSFRGVSHVYQMLARLMPNRFPSGELANKRALNAAFKTCDFDIVHLTSAHPVHDYWRLVRGKRPIVVTIYDLIPEILYGDNRVARIRRRLLRDASHIIAISEYTKRDIMRIYNVPNDKITVIHLGYLKPDVMARVSFPLPKSYVLYVGGRGGYKNFSFFIKAIAPLLKDMDLSLFCTGGKFNADEQSLLVRLGITAKIQQRFVPDAELPDLFANAVAFVYPSIYEGFGLPILDAFEAGCPVVLSRCSCFPEVGGEAALYFDKDDAETLRKHIFNLQSDKHLREEMIAKGKHRTSLFTWEKCAEGTARVYRDVCSK